jgi:hypothetical protein
LGLVVAISAVGLVGTTTGDDNEFTYAYLISLALGGLAGASLMRATARRRRAVAEIMERGARARQITQEIVMANQRERERSPELDYEAHVLLHQLGVDHLALLKGGAVAEAEYVRQARDALDEALHRRPLYS